MGPAILFDKSAIQGLGPRALTEVNHYFHTVVTQVLLKETLADLSLDPDDLATTQELVANLAKKLFPRGSKVNAGYRTLCIHDLLGENIPMKRVPAISGGKEVTLPNGSTGMFVDVQSENEAVLRWQSGQFSSEDRKFAIEWRENIENTNLEEMKGALPKPPVKLKTLEEVGEFVDLLLTQRDDQKSLLYTLFELLQCSQQMQDEILVRWKFVIDRTLSSFAPYAYHFLRIRLIYHTAMMQELVGTRRSNIIDLEYLYYTPFASIFCSGDKLHIQIAPLILQDDQTFVPLVKFQSALHELADARETNPDAEPTNDSLVQHLWQKHWGKDAKRSCPRPPSAEESERTMEKVRPILDALAREQQTSQPKPRFPTEGS